MSVIRISKWNANPTPQFRDMEVGQLAKIADATVPHHNGHIVLRLSDRVIDLNCHDSWSDVTNGIAVELLPPGSVVELTQEG